MLDFNTHCWHLPWLKWAHLHTLPRAPGEWEWCEWLCRWLPVWHTYLIEVRTHSRLCRGVEHPGLPSCSRGCPMIRDQVFSCPWCLIPFPVSLARCSTGWWHFHALWYMLEVAASENTSDILFIMQTSVPNLHFWMHQSQQDFCKVYAPVQRTHWGVSFPGCGMWSTRIPQLGVTRI